MTTFGPESFRVEVEDRRPANAASTESRTLASVRLRSGSQVLTRWVDVEDGERFDRIPDIPLIDLASWLSSSWRALIYDLAVPSLFHVSRSSFAERWALSGLVEGAASEDAYAWASQHALEFAATDYAFPNVVFQRRDDFHRGVLVPPREGGEREHRRVRGSIGLHARGRSGVRHALP